jgi:hypothetical protein
MNSETQAADLTGTATTQEVHVSGTNRFRVVALFGSLTAGVFSLLLLWADPRTCDAVSLENAIYL